MEWDGPDHEAEGSNDLPMEVFLKRCRWKKWLEVWQLLRNVQFYLSLKHFRDSPEEKQEHNWEYIRKGSGIPKDDPS